MQRIDEGATAVCAHITFLERAVFCKHTSSLEHSVTTYIPREPGAEARKATQILFRALNQSSRAKAAGCTMVAAI